MFAGIAGVSDAVERDGDTVTDAEELGSGIDIPTAEGICRFDFQKNFWGNSKKKKSFKFGHGLIMREPSCSLGGFQDLGRSGPEVTSVNLNTGEKRERNRHFFFVGRVKKDRIQRMNAR